MTPQEKALQELAERRLAYQEYRKRIDEEARAWRADRLAVEQSSVEHLVLQAAAAGATVGQIKKAYGTKDHRTIAGLLEERAAEITALREALAARAEPEEWFWIDGENVRVAVDGSEAMFTWADVDDELMFLTTESAWNADYTIQNKAVHLLDGKTQSSSTQATELAKAIREAHQA